MHSHYSVRRAALALPLCLMLAVIMSGAALAQDSKDFAVMLSATTAKTPQPTITLHWNRDPFAKAYFVWRKSKTDPGWPPSLMATLDSNTLEYADDNIEIGRAYEYRVFKQAVQPLTDSTQLRYYGTGYIYAGIEVLPAQTRGKVLLLVDSTMEAPLASELQRLHSDLIREGWVVVQHAVARTEKFDRAAVNVVKTAIVAEYSSQPKMLTSVFIIGRVAVPYSGDLNPDGHPNHLGAWPCDLYYGDMDGIWTDNTVNDDTNAARAENRNVPGDGKFDQTDLPSSVELSVGRADFYDMPQFAESETELLRRYLNKDHLFRIGQVHARLGGIVDDNFSAASYQEAFASAGWRNIAVFGGDTAVRANDWFSSLGGNDTCLWAYGCGGGTYTSAGGVGETSDFAAKPVNAVFTMLFGSYFGDWDSENNFLRAAIAGAGTALTSTWVARPQWYFHHMALGETIGYSTILSQNNAAVYIPNVYFLPDYPNGVPITFENQMTHIALMGDPTLRAQMSAIPVPDRFQATVPPVKKPVPHLEWHIASGSVDGYLLYRASNPAGPFKLITDEPIVATSYDDASAAGDSVTYLLQPVVLRHNASGSYYDGGAAISLDARLADVSPGTQPEFSCGVTPNPVSSEAIITVTLPGVSAVTADVYDMRGMLVAKLGSADARIAGTHSMRWDVRDMHGKRVPAGIYVAKLTAASGSASVKIVVAP